jgi:thiamine-phosphate pyrophosphorylase
MLEECLAIRAKTRAAGATFIVNDYVDLAILAEADGVHLGQEDLPPEAVRKLVGDQMLIGLSTHSPGQAQAAARLGAVDYIGVGPIFATQTKQDVCEPVGLAYLDYVVENIDLPFVAIGGIKQHNIKQVKDHGARTIALVTEIVGAKDVIAQVAAIREQLK